MRIVYVLLTSAGVAGGQKMTIRHVETLNDLGFEAVCYADPGNEGPNWFPHRATIIRGEAIRPDDVVVVPDDSVQAINVAARSAAARVVLHCQSLYPAAAYGGFDAVAAAPERLSTLLCVSPRQAQVVKRLLPPAQVEVVRCFADERVFQPAAKAPVGALAPWKRQLEAAAIQRFHRLLHPQQDISWLRLDQATEAQVAEVFGRASVYLSLSRLESAGMTTLEAMASGCVCAGFTGIGGAAYATPENGFWVAEDDCVAAADALAAALDLYATGGAPLRRMTEAALETARAWSYATFRQELADVWTRLAPEARR